MTVEDWINIDIDVLKMKCAIYAAANKKPATARILSTPTMTPTTITATQVDATGFGKYVHVKLAYKSGILNFMMTSRIKVSDLEFTFAAVHPLIVPMVLPQMV